MFLAGDRLSAAQLNEMLPGPWHVVGAAGEINFTAGWGHFSGGRQAAWRLINAGQTVEWKGSVARTSGSSATVFVVPVALRPFTVNLYFVTVLNGFAPGGVAVAPTGALAVNGAGAPDMTSLEGLTWTLE